MAQGKQKVSWDLCRSNLDLEEYETLQNVQNCV